jgi:DNA-binding NarL/FixJ family response regulator
MTKEITMTDLKTLLESRTIWANIVGLIAVVLAALGFGPSGVDPDRIVEIILQVVAGLSFLASTIFRILATRKIGL